MGRGQWSSCRRRGGLRHAGSTPAVLEKAVAGAFAKRYPSIKGLVSYFAVDFYLDKDVIRQHDLDMKDVEKTAIDALMATGVVERVYTHDELRSIGRTTDPFLDVVTKTRFSSRAAPT